MPKVTKFEQGIPAFYRANAIKLLLFAHVSALIHNEKMTIRDAIDNFIELYDIDSELYDIDSALVAYNDMRQKFIWAKIKN